MLNRTIGISLQPLFTQKSLECISKTFLCSIYNITKLKKIIHQELSIYLPF